MEERNCFVYEDIRMDNWSCYYVGMGSKNEENGYNRFEVAERNDHHDRIMNKYGIARVIIRDNLTRSEANALEEARIYYYVFVLGYTIDIKGYIKGKKSDSHLTNQTWGGDGIKGCNPYANKTEEELEKWKKKNSEAHIGLQAGEKNPMYGKNPFANKSEKEMKEYGENMSKILNERYTNMSEEEKKEKYGRKGEKNPMYGKNPLANKTEEELEEWKRKISEANSGEKNPMFGVHRYGEKNPSARKVRCIETGEIFNTVTEASKWSGTHRSCIASQIKGKRKSAGKHPVTREKLHWEYVVEETIETNLNLSLISNINISI